MIRNMILSCIVVVTYILQGVYYNMVRYNPGGKVTSNIMYLFYSKFLPVILA